MHRQAHIISGAGDAVIKGGKAAGGPVQEAGLGGLGGCAAGAGGTAGITTRVEEPASSESKSCGASRRHVGSPGAWARGPSDGCGAAGTVAHGADAACDLAALAQEAGDGVLLGLQRVGGGLEAVLGGDQRAVQIVIGDLQIGDAVLIGRLHLLIAMILGGDDAVLEDHIDGGKRHPAQEDQGQARPASPAATAPKVKNCTRPSLRM